MTRIASLKVPHYKQEQDGSCTAACVRMVLAYYGRILLKTNSGSCCKRDRAELRLNVAHIASLGYEVEGPILKHRGTRSCLLAGDAADRLCGYGLSRLLDCWLRACAVLVGMNSAQFMDYEKTEAV